MRFRNFSFGSIRINGVTYEHDVVIDRGEIHKREKRPSKKFREDYGHTPLAEPKALAQKEMVFRHIQRDCTGITPALQSFNKCLAAYNNAGLAFG